VKICLFHLVQLPPKDYGGTERFLLWLTKGLLEQGHEVWVGALEGSLLPHGAKLLSFSSSHPSHDEILQKLPAGLDVFHYQAPLPEAFLQRLPCPYLFTLHGNAKVKETFPKNTVFISQDHAKRHGGEFFIHHGADPEEFLFLPKAKTNSHLFLSKTSWSVKNLTGALDLCRKAKVPLRIAGGNRPYRLRARVAFDRICGKRFEWVGPVAAQKKAEILSEAQSLVFPVLWPEPFGLVVIESLFSGTPVLAPPMGSLPELVTPETGALLNTEQEWVLALQEAQRRWDPQACYDRAMEFFHYRVMAGNYERIYQQVAAGKILHSKKPQTQKDWREFSNGRTLYAS
jgi:glycosyltransferase involved in cell wall biosynthesis